MGHSITAILIRDHFDAEAARRYDLRPLALEQSITLFHISHYYSAYWQSVLGTSGGLDVPVEYIEELLPYEPVLRAMVVEITSRAEPTFAIIRTEYFGGIGDQLACAFEGERRITSDRATINEALLALGVKKREGLDEFDTIGLGRHRSSPEYLERYEELCLEAGV